MTSCEVWCKQMFGVVLQLIHTPIIQIHGLVQTKLSKNGLSPGLSLLTIPWVSVARDVLASNRIEPSLFTQASWAHRAARARGVAPRWNGAPGPAGPFGSNELEKRMKKERKAMRCVFF